MSVYRHVTVISTVCTYICEWALCIDSVLCIDNVCVHVHMCVCFQKVSASKIFLRLPHKMNFSRRIYSTANNYQEVQ